MPSTVKTPIQYISDGEGKPVGVFVPIDLWREIESERETAYLLKSRTMRKRLLEAKSRKKGLSLGEVRSQLGIGVRGTMATCRCTTSP